MDLDSESRSKNYSKLQMISSRLLFRTIHSTPLRLHKNPLVLSYSKPFQNLPPRPGPAPSLPRFSRGLPAKSKIPGVSQIIAVSSAKGGVGKSTTAGISKFLNC